MYFIDTNTGTWGAAADVVLVSEDAEAIHEVSFDNMSDSEINDFGREHGVPVAPAVKSQYFHTDDLFMISWLADVLATARDTGTRIRLDVDSQGRLKVKRSGGMWSPPFESTEDHWRDS